MTPFQPSGPRYPWADTNALFKRNALQMGPLAPEAEEEAHQTPADKVEVSTRQPSSPAPREAGDAAEKAERERTKKSYRKPVYPHPQAPAPRQSAGGWLLSRPSSHEKSREMTEDDLELYSRWRREEDSGGGQQEDKPQEEPAAPTIEECDAFELTEAGLDPQTAEPLAAILKVPSGTPGREHLARWLARFGPGILATCRGQGISVVLAPAGITTYREPERRVYVGAAELASAQEGFASLFEAFARAYDVALGEGSSASANSVAVLASVQGNDPVQFFAQAVADYMRGQSGPLHGYVEYLIRQSHARP